jgi:hypothetical protein
MKDDDPALIEDLYDFYSGSGYWPRRDRPVTRAEHERVVDLYRADGQLEGPVPFDKAWDLSLWRDAGR